MKSKKKSNKTFHKDNLKKIIDKLPSRTVSDTEGRLQGALTDVAKITPETLPEHREQVLSGARKFIYPLKHSRRHFVRLSISILVTAIVAFLAFTTVDLYYFQSTSDFLYSVTEVLPLPVAKAGSSWVSYYSYLFELRRNMHYYETQQGVDFSTSSGKLQLANLKKEAMNQVILNAYVKQLASKYNVSVSTNAVNNEISLVRDENRLGTNNQVLESVLKDYWGWTISDFKQELHQELLQQAVVAKLDTTIDQAAASVHKQLESGGNFSALAAQYSADALN